MRSRMSHWGGIGVLIGVILLWAVQDGTAANISDFVEITPYVEVETVYDDNVFEISEKAPLPKDAKEREDLSLNARAGIGVDVMLERPYLTLGVGLNYTFEYVKFIENSEYDDLQNNLDLDIKFSSKYEEGLLRDRLNVKLTDALSIIPIDEDEPIYSGNRAIRNDFMVGADYKLISTRRLTLALGYAYGRTDFFEDDPIEVPTVSGYTDSSVLTQESETHTGKAELHYLLNSRVTCLVTYDYGYTIREENPRDLVSATFTRQNAMGGVQVKLTSRMHGDFQGGYSWTSYNDVDGLTQEDQNSFVAETSLTANFAHQPLMTAGYRKYYVENDFGDTLLTDGVFGRMGFKVAQGLLVNFSGDYIVEERKLFEDETVQKKFGVNSEYALLKNMKLLAQYHYRKKDFFARNFLAKEDREETSHVFSGGMEYKVGRHVLLKGLYSYTDKTSNIPDQEFARNKFVASGKVLF